MPTHYDEEHLRERAEEIDGCKEELQRLKQADALLREAWLWRSITCPDPEEDDPLWQRVKEHVDGD